MTTKVIVEPANHEIEVIVSEDGNVATATDIKVLKIGDPPAEYFVYGGHAITVRDTADAVTQHGDTIKTSPSPMTGDAQSKGPTP
jgi:hypothetical protein